jgi:hypothetical protein
MNDSTPFFDAGARPRGRARRMTIGVIAAATTLVGIGAAVPMLQSSAGATDPCPEPQVRSARGAAPAICPGPGTTTPSTTPPFDFSARTFTLADGSTRVQQPITMTRSFLVPSQSHPGTSDVVAGGSDTVNGADLFGVNGQPPSGATAAVIKFQEAGVPGAICRSQQFGPTANFAFASMLTSDPTPFSGDSLAFVSAFAGGHFAGGSNGLPSNFDVNVTSVGEVLHADGAHLTARGNLTIVTGTGTFKFTFTHMFTESIAPATDANAARVLSLTAPTPGQLVLQWNQTPPANGDATLKFVQAVVEPVLRPLVPAKTAALIDLFVPTQHSVKFFLEQGFTFSVRNVAITPATTDATGKVTNSGALALSPAFCKVEPHP